jgi:hypothetical protein
MNALPRERRLAASGVSQTQIKFAMSSKPTGSS